MKVTKFNDAQPYEAAGHVGCSAFRLQGLDVSPASDFWSGLSHFLPGGGADWDASNAEKVYVVVDGQITVETDDDSVVLGPLDSVFLGAGERRRVLNHTHQPASMVVVVSPRT